MKTLLIFLGSTLIWSLSSTPANAQLLPWRRLQEQRMRDLQQQNQQLLKLLFERRGEPVPQPPPQIIYMPNPYQNLPIERDPRQRLPIEPDPRQRLPIEPDPRQRIPIEPDPRQDLPVEPKPRQDLGPPGQGKPRQRLDPLSRPKSGPPTGYQRFSKRYPKGYSWR